MCKADESGIHSVNDSVPGDSPGIGVRILHEAGYARNASKGAAGVRLRRDGGGALVLLLATSIIGIMPYMLAFAAGAMLYVVVEELAPDYSQGKHSNIGTVGFALGFALMMVLDVVLG